MDASERYSRQSQLPQIGETGQRRLSSSRAAIVGCGALGTVQATLLVRAGVGETVLVDRDCVEASNLQRQCLFDERDAELGTPKAVAAADSLRKANSDVSVIPVVRELTAANAEGLLSEADVILDGSDNFEVRYLVNDLAVRRGIPWIYGAAVGTRGSYMPILPGRTSCLACVFPAAPSARQPTCDTAGVLNAVTAFVGSMQAAEALKILAGRPDAVERRFVSQDVWSGERSAVGTGRPVPGCAVCGRREFRHLDAAAPRSSRLCGRDAVQVPGDDRPVDLAALARALAPLGAVRYAGHVMRFSCPPHELTVFEDGRAIVKGTQDLGIARSLRDRYVGA